MLNTLKTTWLAFALPFALFTAACDGDDKGDIRSTAEIQAEWNTHCDTFAACPDSSNDADECKAGFSCMEAAMRPDMLDKSVACQAARTCTSGGDDPCYSLEAQGLEPSAAAASFQDDCLAKRTTCAGEGASFSDDYCFNVGILEDATVATVAACLSGACAGLEDCFDGAVSAAAPGCE
jgi:hypothetical protein